MEELCLQEKYAAKNACFGCGPSNARGLRLRSFPDKEGDKVKALWQPETFHEAFPGVLNGGIIGSLLDCHSNWTAAWHLMQRLSLEHPPCTVTAEYNIKLLLPTPTNVPLELIAWVVDAKDDRATVQAELKANGKVCARCEGKFVAVKPGHPAYHRW
jgi:acyl-coenzyme A thioesterase PaaI-like protein